MTDDCPSRPSAIHRATLALPFVLSLLVLPIDSPFLLPKRAFLISASALLCVGAAASGSIRMPRGRGARLVTCFAALASAAVIVSWTLSPQHALGLQASMFWLAGPFLAIVVCAKIDRPRPLTSAIALAGAVQSAIVAAQWCFAVNPVALVGVHVVARDRMRLYGTLGNPDFVATFVAATLPSALMGAWSNDPRASGRARGFWRTLIGLDLVAISATGSRAGGVAALTALAVTAWLSRTRLPRGHASLTWRPLLAIVLVATAALALMARNPRSLGESFAGRTTIWRVALFEHAASLTGSGPGTFPRTYDLRLGAYAASRRDPERERFFAYEQTALNDYVQALVETGWLGALTLAGGLGCWMYVVARRTTDARLDATERWSGTIAVGTVAALAVAALGESPFQRADTWALLWLVLALPFASVRTAAPAASQRYVIAPLLLSASLVCVWLAARPVAAAWWVQQGADAESSGMPGSAINAYQRAVSFDSASAVAWFSLSRALTRARNYDAALRASDEAMRLRPEPEVSMLRVRILEAQGAHGYAVRDLAAAVKAYPWRTDLLIEATRLTGSAPALSSR